MRILAIDLGLSKSMFCDLHSGTGAYSLGGFATSAKRVEAVLRRRQPDLVVVEICPLAAMVHDVCMALGVRVLVADTTQDAWLWRNVKRKTDRDDALKLAKLAALGQLNGVHIPAPEMRAWRQLVEQRQAYVAEQTRGKNRIRSLLLRAGQRSPAGKSGWTEVQLALLRQQARPLAECPRAELWRGMLGVELELLQAVTAARRAIEQHLDRLAETDDRMAIVQTLPGVGVRVAEVLVTSLDRAERFATRRQVGAYAGLTPRRYQSGQMDRSGRISKRGRPLLRHALNQAAWVAVRCDAQFRAFFLRLTRNCKGRRKIAIVAVMRRLLVIAWAMLRDRRPYRPALAKLRAA